MFRHYISIRTYLRALVTMGNNNKSDNKMYYRMLGSTGLQVYVLSFGFWATYGVKDGLSNDEGINMAKECM